MNQHLLFVKMKLGFLNIKLDIYNPNCDLVTKRLTSIIIGNFSYWVKVSSFQNKIWCHYLIMFINTDEVVPL